MLRGEKGVGGRGGFFMRSQLAKVGDWLFGDDATSGSIAAAQEPFDTFGPLGELHRTLQEPSRPNPQGPHDCARILIAEADAYHRRVLRVLLASPAISAIEVEDGQSAIDLLTLRSFDLILLSLDLPIMTGADVVRWVRRSQTPWSDIPILGLVNDAEREGLGRVIAGGLTDWTPKPINRQHLADKLIGLMPNLAGTGL